MIDRVIHYARRLREWASNAPSSPTAIASHRGAILPVGAPEAWAPATVTSVPRASRALGRACWRDRRYMCIRRAAYYRYVGALLMATDGRRSLRDFFLDDAHRYGPETSRGRVCATFHVRFEQSGGNLSQAWDGVFPPGDLAVIAMAQREGVRALPTALADLAHTTDLTARVRRTLVATCATAAVATAVVLAMLAAMPWLTVPRLKQIFESVPPEYFGRATRALYAAARSCEVAVPVVVLLGGLAVAAAIRVLPGWTGPTRKRIDGLPIFRLYRDFQAIRFLCALALIIGSQKHSDLRMRDGLQAVGRGASPWLSAHIAEMAVRMETGAIQADVFDTGLFDRETFWFLADVAHARGLGEGLMQVRTRIETSVAAGIVTQSRVMRWTMLLAAVSCALGIALWHFVALDELRLALSYTLMGY